MLYRSPVERQVIRARINEKSSRYVVRRVASGDLLSSCLHQRLRTCIHRLTTRRYKNPQRVKVTGAAEIRVPLAFKMYFSRRGAL